jgi:hypothetical protein
LKRSRNYFPGGADNSQAVVSVDEGFYPKICGAMAMGIVGRLNMSLHGLPDAGADKRPQYRIIFQYPNTYGHDLLIAYLAGHRAHASAGEMYLSGREVTRQQFCQPIYFPGKHALAMASMPRTAIYRMVTSLPVSHSQGRNVCAFVGSFFIGWAGGYFHNFVSVFSVPGFAGAIVGILPTPIDYPMDWILSTHYLQVYSFDY